MEIKWGYLQQYIEERREFFEDIIRSDARSFSEILHAPSRKRLEYARSFFKILVPYLFDEPENIGHWQRFLKLSQESRLYFPSEEIKLKILKEFSYKQLYPLVKELGEEKFMEEELYRKVLDTATKVLLLFDMDHGHYVLREEFFIEGKTVPEIIESHSTDLRRYYWNFYNSYHLPSSRRYAFVMFFGVDAEDNSVLPDALKSENPSEVLKKEFPEKGLKKVLSRKIPKSFSRRRGRSKCPVSAERELLSRKNYKKHCINLGILRPSYVQ